jgi:hypothetical protein
MGEPSAEPARRLEQVHGVSRLLAVGDVQSNYEPLVALLTAAAFVEPGDEGPVWRAGDAALLFLGDLFDGGRQPAEVVWLLMRLHEQALSCGGRVLLVEGNHEMTLFAVADGGADGASALGKWFSNGGFETLLRLAAAVGMPVPERLVAQIYTATLGDLEHDPEVQQLARAVVAEYAPELAFLRSLARPAVAINGSVLAVHAAPNFEAERVECLVRDERDAVQMAWSRGWLDDWRPGAAEGPFIERLATLKRRLDAPPDFELRLLLFAHTGLAPLAVPGFRDALFRVGRLVGPDLRPDLPATYDLMTAPREVPRGGALGGLLLDSEGVTAIYGSEVQSEDRRWPSREKLDGPDLAFTVRGSA